jgi:hypothetical protein
LASSKWLPTPSEFLEWCVEADRRMRKRQVAEAVPAAASLSGDDASGLRRCVEKGEWDRWYAYASSKVRLRREPTSEEVNARLREMVNEVQSTRAGVQRTLKGPLEAALALRISLDDGRCV